MQNPAHPSSTRHVLVTGGGRGIGRAIATAFKEDGATVSIIGRDRAALDAALATAVADRAYVADVTDPHAVEAAIREAEGVAPIEVLVANAGAAESAPFLKHDPALFRRMFDVNVVGVVNAVQAVLPGMLARKSGRIIAIASTAGLKGYAYVSAYSAAKHAAIGLVRSLALEVARDGITVNAVCPGFTDTDLVGESLERIMQSTGRDRAAALASLTKHNPQGRLVEPGEVADAARWLAGPGAGSVTGQAITVAGGEL
ncbi:SDR family NAD(P)-dependent oxidoreductase [Methylobacterium dankookense]|uniref:Ketoacyl reductase n=1 Tax=Methylobacterium dankookense TaxID=560405 RepID=A0A564G6D5_9HYPH|nr:SDR family NAD(P)-dependent oxidoreductase [Methylobacterium dankookense]GJD59862.1 Putative ketoacyl reductase [Methylobacterium dankookense]VUF16099.1 Putative ketoacyl reductase [Methylobacterium dankookense]